MTDTTAAESIERLRLRFQLSPCGRCGGSGMHGPKQVQGGRCFTCGGSGEVITRNGARALEAYRALMTERMGTPAEEITEGTRVYSCASRWVGFEPASLPWAWRTVHSAEMGTGQNGTVGDEEPVKIRTVHLRFDGKGDDGVTHSETAPLGEPLVLITPNREVQDQIMREVAKRFKGAWLNTEEPPAPAAPRLRKSADMEPAKPVEKPKPLPENIYPGTCARPDCGQHVEAKAGERFKADGRWAVQHRDGECPAVEERPTPAPVVEATPADGSTPRHDIVITRAKLYPEVARPGPAWVWSYDYYVDGGPVCQYGPGLISLRAMLRERFGTSGREMWKAKETPAPAEAAPQHEPNLYGGACRRCSVWVEAENGERLRVSGKWLTQHKAGACPERGEERPPVTAEGLYRVRDTGTLYRVKTSGAGRLYAQRIARTGAGHVRFEREPGAISRLSPEDRMTVEAAEKISQDWDRCIKCGAELTASRGMGPVCRKKI